MKSSLLLTVAFVILGQITVAEAAPRFPLNGFYKVQDSNACAFTFGLRSASPVKVKSNEAGVSFINGTRGFSIEIGKREVGKCPRDARFCYGAVKRFLDSSYGASNARVTALSTFINKMSGGNEQANGQIDVVMDGLDLVITSTTSHQPTATAPKTCVLKRSL